MTKYYLVDGVRMEKPPAPSPHHEWDGVRWVLSAVAREAKAMQATALAALAAADARRVRALSDHALGIPGADLRLSAIEADCVPHREALAAAREALKQ